MARLKADDPRMIRKGDSVQVIIPKKLIRVGYENCKEFVLKEVQEALLKVRREGETEVITTKESENKTSELTLLGNKFVLQRVFKEGEVTPGRELHLWFNQLEDIVKRNFNCEIFGYREKFVQQVIGTIAYEIVKQRMRNPDVNYARKKFEEDIPEIKYMILNVVDVHFKKVGQLIPASYYHDSYYSENEYEPGYLEDEKTIRVLDISNFTDFRRQEYIDAAYVEKVIQYDRMSDEHRFKWICKYYDVLTIRQKAHALAFFVKQAVWPKDLEYTFEKDLERIELYGECLDELERKDIKKWLERQEAKLQHLILNWSW